MLEGENFDLSDEGAVSPLPLPWKHSSDNSKEIAMFPEPDLVKSSFKDPSDYFSPIPKEPLSLSLERSVTLDWTVNNPTIGLNDEFFEP